MRPALLVFSLLLTSHAAWSATAYEALRTLGKAKGEALLDSVTEVRGDKGAPQPRTWRILVQDAAARGGAKEYSVQGAKLAGEQAARASGAPMNMSQLNLDSDGVHTIAEREAKKAAFPYDNASYILRAGSKGGSPVWEIRLTDEKSGDTAMLNIAATTGNVLATEGLTGGRPVAANPTPTPAPAPRVQPAHEERTVRTEPRGGSARVERAGEHLDRFFNRAGNHMERRGRQIGDFFHNFFTGDNRDTAGPHGSRPGPTPLPPRKGDEDYVRPSRVRD